MKIKQQFIVICLIMLGALSGYAQRQTPITNTSHAEKTTIIEGEFLNAGDTLMVVELTREFGSGNSGLTVDTSVSAPTSGKRFKIVLPTLLRSTYVTLTSGAAGNPAIFLQYYIEPGDSIHVVYDALTKKVNYSGRGSLKFWWHDRMNADERRISDSQEQVNSYEHPEQHLADLDEKLAYHLHQLDLIKDRLSTKEYFVSKADVIAANRKLVYDFFRFSDFGRSSGNPELETQMDQLYKDGYYQRPKDTIDEDFLRSSAYYALYLLSREEADFAYQKFNSIPQAPSLYEHLKKGTPGYLRDKVITAHLVKELGFSLLSDSVLSDAILTVKTPVYNRLLVHIQDQFGKGNTISTFNFPDKDGRLFSMAKFRGKVVFMDMWFTGCSGCIQVAKALPGVEEAFKNNPDVLFVSLSIDKDKKVWMNSIDPAQTIKGGYTHYTTPSTLYLYTAGTGTNNQFIKKYNLTSSYPHLLLIGKDGRIIRMDPTRPDTEGGQGKLIAEIKEALTQ
ncbi:TlpA family protein disulfide reductase [Mucilaginibacter kameinonensis]|uniref:TlpA family protein disulfide reductase n=1 Tax=Mucilaginibacter kameinonensis TaxID=452286 RepID=UPI000EF79786|nr:thioredoxin family protein [Mucilaginibacter kameinonensis]